MLLAEHALMFKRTIDEYVTLSHAMRCIICQITGIRVKANSSSMNLERSKVFEIITHSSFRFSFSSWNMKDAKSAGSKWHCLKLACAHYSKASCFDDQLDWSYFHFSATQTRYGPINYKLNVNLLNRSTTSISESFITDQPAS